MSSVALEWLVILMFLLFVFGLTFAEAFWLSKKNWTTFGKSLAFALTTNAVGFFVGLFVLFVVFGLMLMFSLDGSLQRNPLGEAGIIVAMVFGVLFFPVFLALCKRLFLKILKIREGKAAWIFSFASSFLIVFLALVVPCLAGYLLFR
ncbi:MAG: hypothetical protein WA584_04980 [Pyrinomonadaceae bacterium]